MSVLTQLIRRVIHPAYLHYAGEGRVLVYLRAFERTQYDEPAEILRRQTELLQRLLAHAHAQCPFYRDRFQRAGLEPSDIKTAADMSHVPIVTRSDVQQFGPQMVATNWPRGDLLSNRTGGSTGEPVSFFLSRDRQCSRTAATIRHNRWAGLDIGDRVAVLWAAPRDRAPSHWRAALRNLLLDRQLFLDAAHLTEEKMLAYNEELKQYRPQAILAYARAAVVLAQFLRSRGVTAYEPAALITSAEVLTEPERRLLEETFACPVFNRYGCREVSVIASECERHQGMHVMAERLLVEIVHGRTLKPVAPGELGVVLITDLVNHAMPLVRYRIGDCASWEPGACACGRGLPRLRSVAGRVTDFLLGSDGRLVSGAFLTIAVVAQRATIGQMQILQDVPGRVLYRIKPGPGFRVDEELAYLARTTKQFLGDGMRIDWEIVDGIAPEPSGKYVFSRSTVVPDFAKERR